MSLSQARDVFLQIDPPIWLLTSASAGEIGGLVATFVVSASIVPEMPRVLVGLAKQHHTWNLVRNGSVFSLTLLADDQIDLVWRFGTTSGRAANKFIGLPFQRAENGCPMISGGVGQFGCEVESSLDTGDRTVFLGAIRSCEYSPGKNVLRMSRVFSSATPELLSHLREQMQRDASIDGSAITNWRRELGLS